MKCFFLAPSSELLSRVPKDNEGPFKTPAESVLRRSPLLPQSSHRLGRVSVSIHNCFCQTLYEKKIYKTFFIGVPCRTHFHSGIV